MVGLLVLWYLASTRWGVSHLLLPNPVRVWEELKDVLGTGEFLPDLKVTLGELAAAFALSSTTGITLGYLVSRSQYLIRVFEPLLAGIYSIPIILFLPLYVLFFGLGPASKIALGATISFFPIVLNTVAGFGYVDRIYRHRRALDGRLGFPDVPLRAAAGGAAGHPDRPAYWVHDRVALLSSAARPSPRSPALATGSCTWRKRWRCRACSHTSPLRSRSRRCSTPSSARSSAGHGGNERYGFRLRRIRRLLLRRPGLARLGVVAAAGGAVGGGRALVDRSHLPEPAVARADLAQHGVPDPGRAGGAADDVLRACGRVRDLGRDRARGRALGRAVALFLSQRHADHPAAVRHSADHHPAAVHSLFRHRIGVEDRLRRQPRNFPDHRNHRRRRAEHQANPRWWPRAPWARAAGRCSAG